VSAQVSIPFLRPEGLAHWIESWPQAPSWIDLGVVAALAASTAFAARSMQLGTLSATAAGVLALVHPAVAGAIPGDARALLLASSAGLVSFGLLAGMRRGAAATFAGTAALAIAWFLHAPAACAFAAASMGSLILQAQTGARALRAVATLLLFASCYVLSIVAGARHPGAFAGVAAGIFPVQMLPDGRYADDWVFVAAPVAVAGTAALHWVGGRSPAPLCLVLAQICAFPILSRDADYLHDRAAAACAASGALAIALAIDVLLSNRTARVRVAAFGAVALLFVILAYGRFSLARHAAAYVEFATQTCPRSDYLQEARAHLRMVDARRIDVPAAERQRLRANAREAFSAAAATAPAGRKFRLYCYAIDASIDSPDPRLAGELFAAAASAASTPSEKADLAILRARRAEQLGDPQAALRCLAASKDLFDASPGLRHEYEKRAVAAAAFDLAAARKRGDSAGIPGALAACDAIERDLAPALDPARPAPERSRALALRGKLQMLRGNGVDAARDLNDARRLDPANIDASMALADLYLSQGLAEGAMRELALALAAAQPAPPQELYLQMAAVQLQMGAAPENVLKLIEAAAAAGPETVLLKSTLAAVHVLAAEKKIEKGDQSGAEQSLQIALEGAPGVARVHSALGRLRDLQKRPEDAADCYQKAYELAPSDETKNAYVRSLKTKAIARLYAKDRTAALTAFRTLRSLGESGDSLGVGEDMLLEEAKAAYDRGVAALGRKDRAAAEKEFNNSLADYPDNFYTLNILGTLKADAEDYDSAARYWVAAIAAAKKQKLDLAEFGTHYNLAQEYRRSGKLKECRELLQEYLALGRGPHRVKCEALLEVVDALEK
jgi:tetratricopeptide (TPR) repeat protein